MVMLRFVLGESNIVILWFRLRLNRSWYCWLLSSRMMNCLTLFCMNPVALNLFESSVDSKVKVYL